MKQRRVWLWSLLLWSVPAWLCGAHVYRWMSKQARPMGFWKALLSEAPPWYVMALFTPWLLGFARRYPLRRPLAARNVALQILAFIVVTLVVTSVFDASFLLRRPTWTFDVYREFYVHVLSGFLPSVVLAFCLINREAVLALHAEAAQKAERQRAELTVQLAEAQLREVESYLHPHFLFNTLDGVLALVRSGSRDEAARALTLLGDLLRAMLAWRQTDEIKLGDELAFLRSYLELWKVRLADRLRVTWAIEPGLEEALIPPLALQPLVENAFRHGIEQRTYAGELVIGARVDGDELELFVEDDGPGPAPELDLTRHAGLGLSRTQARLAELYGSAGATGADRARRRRHARVDVAAPPRRRLD